GVQEVRVLKVVSPKVVSRKVAMREISTPQVLPSVGRYQRAADVAAYRGCFQRVGRSAPGDERGGEAHRDDAARQTRERQGNGRQSDRGRARVQWEAHFHRDRLSLIQGFRGCHGDRKVEYVQVAGTRTGAAIDQVGTHHREGGVAQRTRRRTAGGHGKRWAER